MNTFDIYMVGVGGQGILTIGEILSEAALVKDKAVNFYPSKGMAQRGGFVKAQLRLGREKAGPNIPPHMADMVIAMETSEALKAIRFIKPGGDFVLFGDPWLPTAVMLGKASYPAVEDVKRQIKSSGAKLFFIDPCQVPEYQGEKVPDNIFILGAILKQTALGQYFQPEAVEQLILKRWKRRTGSNQFAFQSGMNININ